MNRSISSVALASAQSATGAGETHNPLTEKLSFQAVGRTTSGAGTAVVSIEVSNVPEPSADDHWITALEISLTLTNANDVSDGQQIDAAWRHVRANVTEITGTGATVDVYMAG